MNVRVLLAAAAIAVLSASGVKAQGYYEQPQPYEEPAERPYQRDHDRPRHHEYGQDEERDDFPGQLHGLHAGCERGDRAACVRLGWVLHEHRDRREEWRRRRPEFYWWDQR